MHWWRKSASASKNSGRNSKSKGSLGELLRSRIEKQCKSNGSSMKEQGQPNGPHLTRTRKLRHVSDEEVGNNSPNNWGGSGRAVPLPLPSPKQRKMVTGEEGPVEAWDLPSSDESEESFQRPGTPSSKVGQLNAEAKASPQGLSFINTDHKLPEHASARSVQFVLGSVGQSLKGHKGVQRDMSSKLHLNLGGVAKSAPTTVFSSPAISPRRMSSGDFLLSNNYKTTKEQDLGIPLSIPPLGQNLMADMIMQPLADKVLISPDRSPLQSPRMRSPRIKSRIHSGAVSPLHPNFLTGPYDDSANVSVHRLPLPPGNASPVGAAPSPNSPSLAVQRSSLRTDASINPGQWKKGKLLGSGTFGTVYVGFNRETGDMCAMKEVPLIPDDPKSSESIKQLEQEINLLSQLKHPNIVQYYGSETLEDAFYIYLEYVPGGSIFKILKEYGPLPESVIRIYTRQILSGLAYLHSKNTVHRDIKGANLLADTSGKIKLADFGMAKHINGPATPLSLKGSPYWMAPELMMQKNTGHDLAVDIWSLGCTVIEMAMGKPPWSEYEGAAAMFKVFKSEVPSIPDTLSVEGKDFISCCLCRNPAERLTACQLLDHTFVRDANHQDSDPLASTTSCIKSLNLVHSPREKSMNTSEHATFHTRNGNQHQLSSEHIHPQIGTSTRSSNQQLSPRSTLEAFSSLSPPHSNVLKNEALFGSVENGYWASATHEGPLKVRSSLQGRLGAVGIVNIADQSEYSTDHNLSSPVIRTPEGSPKRWDYGHDDIMHVNFSRRPHEFEEDHGKRFVREIAPQGPVMTLGYPTIHP
ncbi:mitogen-activated protein kinase kinase kinase 5 [Cryptomeria japonica]|uniref:mitogen-activated protein kinase kinase kinase 5 n=1 Tax=Cryptomeria japonica TaxID=3369 RepID=UPI0027DA42B0|nr:mitogen-activated protein kinase kinase kinase 5 [Cryptomeria japonica]XP_057837744.2 mitogen-activated protein kinase kinase kinase 5 [Cryptomeria japonica]